MGALIVGGGGGWGLIDFRLSKGEKGGRAGKETGKREQRRGGE